MKKFKVGEKYKVCEKGHPEDGNIIQITNVFSEKVVYETIQGKNFGATTFAEGSIFSNTLKPVKNECIVVYRKDDEVIALDKSTGEKAIARCHPDDKFDFKIGAKVAFERLIGEESQKVLNTKICITKCDGIFRKPITVGKIYEIKHGRFIADDGEVYPVDWQITDIDALKKYFTPGPYAHFCAYKVEFVEVVE